MSAISMAPTVKASYQKLLSEPKTQQEALDFLTNALAGQRGHAAQAIAATHVLNRLA